MKIPLNLLQNEDAPIWKCSRNGSYNVCSAYYNLMENVIVIIISKWKAIGRNFGNLKSPTRLKSFFGECFAVVSLCELD
jgi:hypothetical protein